MEEIRLNKYLSDKGVCARREADRLIAQGRVSVDGETATTGMKIRPSQVICVGKKQVSEGPKREILLAVNKPEGVICTTDKRERRNIVDFVGYPTNNGELVTQILKASNAHEREYLVTVNKPVTEAFLKQMREGVHIRKVEKGEVLLDAVTRPCKVERTGKQGFRIILTQGLNRQIRRMCETLGYRVERLRRVRIMNIELKGIAPGHYREVTGEEYKELCRLLGAGSE